MCTQAEQLSQHASKVSRLEAEVGDVQSRLHQLAQERDSLSEHLHAKAESLREAERAIANQQDRLMQQQRQAEDTAQATDKVTHP